MSVKSMSSPSFRYPWPERNRAYHGVKIAYVSLCPAGKHSAQISLSKVKSPPDHGQKPTQRERVNCAHTYTEKSDALLRGAREGTSTAEQSVCAGPLPRYTWGAGLPHWLGWEGLLERGNYIERGEGNLGMSGKKLGFKPLLLNSTEISNQGKKPF